MSYPKTLNKNQCISKCYQPDTNIMHPITLENVTMTDKPFCAIVPKTENNERVILEQCSENDIDKKDDDQINILYPLILFNHSDFLKTYYQINDINDFYYWLKTNKMTPIFTKLRLFDCIINAFGKDITIVESIFIETIIEIIKKYWIKMMYSKLCKYVGFSQKNELQLMKPENNKLNKMDNVEERTRYIISTIITTQNLTNIINNYFNEITNRKELGINDFYIFIVLSLEEKIQKI